MQKLQIFHETTYVYDQPVRLGEQRVLLRPRDDHDLRIESSKLEIRPEAQVVWYRDELDNSVARLRFAEEPTKQLTIISELVLSHYAGAQNRPLEPEAWPLPLPYHDIQKDALAPWLSAREDSQVPASLMAELGAQAQQALPWLNALNAYIHGSCSYAMREEPGVKPPAETLGSKAGSCRDYAWLFIAAARQAGIAARFVSGYLRTEADHLNNHTHAWAEVYLPRAGWIGFDPTCNCLVGNDHVPVSVSRFPEDVPPVSGSFFGPANTVNLMAVNVRVSQLESAQAEPNSAGTTARQAS